LQAVLQAIEDQFIAQQPTSQGGSMQVINDAVASVKPPLEPGLGSLVGQDVVLQNVGGVVTTIKPNGQIIIQNAQGQVILDLRPK
jgi:hypothetical protein